MSIVHDRAVAVAATVDHIRAVGLSAGDGPEKVAAASAALAGLAAQPHLFPVAHFPEIRPGLTGFYRLIEDRDYRNALFIAVSSIEFTMAGAHSHAGWALIAGVAGTEVNILYERADDGAVEGHGRLRKTREVPVRKGDVLYIAETEYHTVAYDGTEPAINLHFYGLGLDDPAARRAFFPSPDSDRYEINPGPHRRKGVPKIDAAEIAAARAREDLEILLLGGDAILPGATRVDDPAEARLSRAGDGPVLLVGEAPEAGIAAERLARQARRPIVRASVADAERALL